MYSRFENFEGTRRRGGEQCSCLLRALVTKRSHPDVKGSPQKALSFPAVNARVNSYPRHRRRYAAVRRARRDDDALSLLSSVLVSLSRVRPRREDPRRTFRRRRRAFRCPKQTTAPFVNASSPPFPERDGGFARIRSIFCCWQRGDGRAPRFVLSRKFSSARK